MDSTGSCSFAALEIVCDDSEEAAHICREESNALRMHHALHDKNSPRYLDQHRLFSRKTQSSFTERKRLTYYTPHTRPLN